MADLSPELAARVQSLEASYADNPGRYFVPLASAWREGGDIARAEEILRENLKRFPGLSAHVLLGRCLADRGAFQEAANEFHYVLSIDSQNLIALRTLAEMAAAGGRRAEAEKWYNELLAVDPMNVEGRSALAQLARAAAAEPPSSAPAHSADDGEFGMIDLSAPGASPADASGVAADVGAGEWGDLTLDAPSQAETQPSPAAEAGEFDAFGFGSVEITEDTSGSGASADSTQWMDARQDVGESAEEDDGYGDLPLLDDGMIEAPLAGAGLPLLDTGSVDDDNDLVTTVSQPGAGFGFGEPAGTFDDGAAPQDDGHDVDAEMVTETMAELYASQGLRVQAVEVYRELIGQRGEEPGLVRRLAEIEAQMQPEPAAASPDPADAAPDWLQSVDDFARGAASTPADEGMHGGLPELDLSPELADEERAASTGLDAESSAAADELGLIEPEYASADFSFASADSGPVDSGSTEFGSTEFGSTDLGSTEIGSAGLGSTEFTTTDFGVAGGTEIDEVAVVEPAALDDFAAIAGAAEAAAGFEAGESAPAPDFAPASASADPFADSFAGGFEGAAAEPAEVSADDGRQPWQAPVVAETEPVGFDILVMEDEDGAEVPASSEVVADMSADWAMAAAPLDEEDEDEAVPAVTPAFAAPAQEPAFAATPGRTMAGYFSSLLAWQPAPPAADAEPSYEVSAEGGTITFEPAEAPPAESASSESLAPADWEASAPAEAELPSFPSEPSPFSGAAPAIPTFDAPSFQPPAPPSFRSVEPEAPAPADDEPWAAAEDEPWNAAPEAPAADDGSEDAGALPLLDLDEPWAESPAAPREPVDIGEFELADDTVPAPADFAADTDAGAAELLPWEMPAEPAAAEPEVPAAGGGFSFEDFFSGAPAGPTPEALQPEPVIAAPPVEPDPSFISSFAEPTPPPVFQAPAPVAPPAAPAPPAPAVEAEGEDDEDLESFQAWLQSLKR